MSAHKDKRAVDFYDVKADVFKLIENYGLDPNKLICDSDVPSYYHSGKSVALKLGKNLLAYAGQINPRILKNFDLLNNVFVFEIFVDNLPALRTKHAKSAFEVSNFQPVSRDFAFVVGNDVKALDFIKTIKSVDQKLIEDVTIFDIYSGDKIEEGKKSVAISVRIQPTDKTLSDEEINGISNKIISEVSAKLNANLR
jgi:phenylalanyl-tRNA synthetase beta chain